MNPSLATMAQYFKYGIEAGICSPDDARAWAISQIDALDSPPGEIIEISWSKPLPDLLEDLKAVPGEADLATVQEWLLATLRQRAASNQSELARAIGQALQVTRSINCDDDLQHEFDRLDDTLNLAIEGIYGSVSECRQEFYESLARFSKPPINTLQDSI